MICKHFVDDILKQAWTHLKKEFFKNIQLNGFKCCYVIQIILFYYNHLFAHS